MSPAYDDHSSMAALYPLVAVYRHDKVMCRPGMYGVVFCMDLEWMTDQTIFFPAVADDFGNLVRVQ